MCSTVYILSFALKTCSTNRIKEFDKLLFIKKESSLLVAKILNVFFSFFKLQKKKNQKEKNNKLEKIKNKEIFVFNYNSFFCF